MSAFADEQSDEVEVLKSIFPDEFEELGAEPWHFKLHLKPNDGSEEHGKKLCANEKSAKSAHASMWWINLESCILLSVSFN
jgi:hypothetical protein